MAISNSNTAGGAIQGQPQAQPIAKPRQLGSGFTNLQKVIGANKGNQLGSAVATGMGNRVGQIKNDLGTAQQKFNTDLQGNRVDNEENKSFVQNSLQNATTAAADQNNVNKFQSLLAGGYAGPQGLGNADTINAQAAEAAQYGNAATTSAGRTNLLQRYAGGNGYNQGQQRLDNLLLGQTGANELKQVRRDASGLGSQINNAATTAQSQAQAAAAANKGFAQDVRNQVGGIDDPNTDADESKGAYGDLYNALGKKAGHDKDQKQSLYDRIQAALTNDGTGDLTVDQDVADVLGVSNNQRTADTNLSQFSASFDPTTFTRDRVATTDDYARAQALAKLSGVSNDFLTNRDMANTAGDVSFDKDQFGRTLSDADMRATGAEKDVSNTQDTLNSGTQAFTDNYQKLLTAKNAEIDARVANGSLSAKDAADAKANFQTQMGPLVNPTNALDYAINNGRDYFDNMITPDLAANYGLSRGSLANAAQTVQTARPQLQAQQSALQQLLAKNRRFVIPGTNQGK